MVGWNEIFHKIRWLVKSILALEPKFHEDWCKNGNATRKKPKNDPKNVFLKNPPGFWTFKKSSWIFTSNQSFWPAPIYWYIIFVLKCDPRISFSRTRGPPCDKSHFQKDPCAHGFSLEFKYKEAFEVCTVFCEDWRLPKK